MEHTAQTKQNLHQQALDKIIENNVDWYLLVLKIAKNDPQAILNAFPKEEKKEPQTMEEVLENTILKMLVPNQNGICATIPAIKRYREITGKELWESKAYVESLVPKAKGFHS